MKKEKQVAKLLEFNSGGHVLHYDKGEGYGSCHSSGYCDPESFCKPYHWWADEPEKLSTHWEGYEFPAEGILVLDKREAIETPAGYEWVFRGPLLDVKLGQGEIERLGEVSPIMAPAIAAYGMAGCLADTMLAKRQNRAGSLDSVGVQDYVQGWREHGAKVGQLYVEEGKARIEMEA